MTQQNKVNTNGRSYIEFSGQYGNLYAIGYAVAESEVKSALSRILTSLRNVMARPASSKSRPETGVAPVGRNARAKLSI